MSFDIRWMIQRLNRLRVVKWEGRSVLISAPVMQTVSLRVDAGNDRKLTACATSLPLDLSLMMD